MVIDLLTSDPSNPTALRIFSTNNSVNNGSYNLETLPNPDDCIKRQVDNVQVFVCQVPPSVGSGDL